MKRVVAAGLVAAALVSGGAARAATHPLDPGLTVVGAAAPVAMAGSPVAVRVVVHNDATPLACRPFEVTLWWKSGSHWPHQRTFSVASTLNNAAATVSIPARAVRPGTLSYAVTVTQACGLLMPYRTYWGRSPEVGARTMTVLG